MKAILRMIFHLPDPDHEGLGDARFIFRRKKERQFLRNFLGAQVIIFIVFLFGIGIAFNRHSATTQQLLDLQMKGHRYTAGNGWQQAQLSLSGEVDMRFFPEHLIYPEKTEFHRWLHAHGFLIEDETGE